MAKKLLIVESPSKAKTIGKYLGKDFIVQATVGHIRDLPKKELGVDLDNDFNPKYITIRGKGEIIKKLKAAAKKSDEILIATDPDREGEAIAFHISEIIGGDRNIQRVLFNEITKSGINAGLKSPRGLDYNIYLQIFSDVHDKNVSEGIKYILIGASSLEGLVKVGIIYFN